MRRILITVGLVGIFALMISACAQQKQVGGPVKAAELPERTSVLVIYRSPTPTAYQTATTQPAPGSTPTPNNDPEFYDGGLTISFDSVGATTQLRLGQSFLLSLGDSYTWKIELEPAGLISQNMKIPLEPGEQGVFIARERGKAVLRAVGVPICRQSQPPCARPDVLFTTIFDVK